MVLTTAKIAVVQRHKKRMVRFRQNDNFNFMGKPGLISL